MKRQTARRRNRSPRRHKSPSIASSPATDVAPRAASTAPSGGPLPATLATSGRPGRKAQSLLLGLVLLAATVLAYQPVWHAGFIWDDDAYVTRNQLLTAP